MGTRDINERFRWDPVYIDNPDLRCDFCNQPYSSVGRDDDWLNACEPCAAEGAAQLELDEKRYPVLEPTGPEVYTYSPNPPRKVYKTSEYFSAR
jgi:hypothetical protein